MTSFTPINTPRATAATYETDENSNVDVNDTGVSRHEIVRGYDSSSASPLLDYDSSASQSFPPGPTAVKKRELFSPDKSFSEKVNEVISTVRSTTPVYAGKTRKRNVTEQTSGPATKKIRQDRFADLQLEVLQLPYQSIICINMPPRIGVVPGQPIPEPNRQNLPFGATEDYYNSMIIHYLDELELTYTKATELYLEKFPLETITEEALRKRHIRSLLRLSKKYGLKAPDAIGNVSQVVKRRGHARAKRLHTIQADATHSGIFMPSPDSAPANHPATSLGAVSMTTAPEKKVAYSQVRTTNLSASERDFEKACMVIWHDADKMSFKDIRNKLEDEYGWSIGLRTIEKHYYMSIKRVYGPGGKKAKKENWAKALGNGRAAVNEGDRVRPETEFPAKAVERRMSI